MNRDDALILAAAGSANAALTDLIQLARDLDADPDCAPDAFATLETTEELADALKTVLWVRLRSDRLDQYSRGQCSLLHSAVSRFLEGWA